MTTNADSEAELGQAIAELRALLAAATPGDLSTAERHTESETVECPACQGDGEIEAADYCNFDGKALGVQFYGIGHEFGAHEKLWTAMIKALPMLLDAADPTRHRTQSTAALTGEVERLREAKAIAAAVVQSACESEPADPEHLDTIAISCEDLECIVRMQVELADERAALSTPSEVSEPVADEIGGEGSND